MHSCGVVIGYTRWTPFSSHARAALQEPCVLTIATASAGTVASVRLLLTTLNRQVSDPQSDHFTCRSRSLHLISLSLPNPLGCNAGIRFFSCLTKDKVSVNSQARNTFPVLRGFEPLSTSRTRSTRCYSVLSQDCMLLTHLARHIP